MQALKKTTELLSRDGWKMKWIEIGCKNEINGFDWVENEIGMDGK